MYTLSACTGTLTVWETNRRNSKSVCSCRVRISFGLWRQGRTANIHRWLQWMGAGFLGKTGHRGRGEAAVLDAKYCFWCMEFFKGIVENLQVRMNPYQYLPKENTCCKDSLIKLPSILLKYWFGKIERKRVCIFSSTLPHTYLSPFTVSFLLIPFLISVLVHCSSTNKTVLCYSCRNAGVTPVMKSNTEIPVCDA